MKWTKLKAERFGPLRHWEGEITAPFAVFLGKNEAGKSTMMELMCTLLFGAHKKKADAKKLITWGSPSSQIEGTLQRDDGSEVTLQRTLRLTGMKGSVLENGNLSELDDRPLSCLSPVDRELYRNIYALSLSDLLFPGQEAWALTQDQLLSGTSGQHRPASQVREELYRSAMSLWRPDRRGKTRMEELDAQLRDLYDRMYQSKEDIHRMDELENSSRACQEEISLLRQKQQSLQEALEAAMTLREQSARLEEGRKLLAEAGNIEMFDDIPDDAEDELVFIREMQRDLARQVAESGRRLAQLSEQLERFSFREERLLEHAEEIERLCEQLPLLRETAQALPTLLLQTQIASQEAARYLDNELRDLFQESENVSAAELKCAADQALDAHMNLLQSQEQLVAARKRSRSAWPWVTGSLGLVLLLSSVLFFPPLKLISLPPVPGIDWIAFGLTAALGIAGISIAAPLAHIIKSRKTRSLREAVNEAAAQDENALALLMEKAQPLHPRQEFLADANELSLRCQKYAVLALQQEDLLERCRLLQNRSIQESSQIQALARDLLAEPTDDPLLNLESLKEALDNARRWQVDSDEIYRQMSEERTNLTQLKLKQQKAVDEEQDMLNLLYQVPGEDIAQKLAEIQRRRRASARGAALMQAPGAEKIPSHEEIDALITRTQQALDEALNQLQALYNTQGSISQKLEQLKHMPPVEELEGQIQSITEQQSQLTKKRDEEALLFALVKVAEQRFRDQHQPDVVRRASSYLSQITCGRYSRIVMTEDQQGIRIYSPDAGEFIDPTKNRLSQGTSEQVFLSLRLGLVDHLDPEGESLPLLLDETFVNWDHDRLVRGLSVLAQVAAKRQLILFTCHPWMLKALDEAGCHYQLIDMEGK